MKDNRDIPQPKNRCRKPGTFTQLFKEKKNRHEICRQMDGTRKKIIQSKVTQTQKDKHDMHSIISRYQLQIKG